MSVPTQQASARAIWRRRLLALQAGYYGVTGVWPIVHLPSFEAVTGPKTDDWLVRMVGLLAVAIAAALGVAVSREREYAPEIVVLAVSGALAFASIDLWYGLTGRIAPVYLLEGVAELGILVVLILTRRRSP